MMLEEIKKLKVAELREALRTRGLETKGNKPVLVKRLERAVKAEAGEEVADDSINDSTVGSADDSTTEPSQESIEIPAEDAEESKTDRKKDEEQAIVIEEESEVNAQPVVIEDEKPSEIEDAKVEETVESKTVEETPSAPAEEPAVSSEQDKADNEPETNLPSEVQSTETKEEDDSDKKLTKQEQNVVDTNDVAVKVEIQVKDEAPAEEEPMQEDNAPKQEEVDISPPEVKQETPEIKIQEMETETTGNEEKRIEKESSEIKKEETVGPDGEVLQVVDSVGEVDEVIPIVEKDDGSRKRRRSRSRSPHRRHRSRHSRSRSPRRRSRSEDRKRRSGSRERRDRSGSRDRYGRVKARDSYHQRRETEESDEWVDATNVRFDKYNCDLHIRIKDDGYKCNPITVEGFAFMWAGVRSNYGVTKGKVAFECKILEHLNVDHLPEEEKTRHVVRVGFSTDSSTMQLGEEKFSYGYGGTGKASTECKFKDFGEKFGEGDVIAAYLDMDSDPITISYTKNGTDLGTCFEIERSELGEQALFPHILTKNSEFEVNFGQMENPFHPLRESFAFLNDIPEAERVRGTKPPSKKEDCEMIMMCGLPGAGKTFWANKYSQQHHENRFNVLGTNNIIDKMKVMGLPRKGNYSGRWDTLIDKSTKCLTRLLEIASKKKRNYILDQTNVYPTAQRRKMRPFEGFQRRAVVIMPTDEVFKERVEKREKEEGKEIPDNAVWEMKANFKLPEEGQCFDKVEFVELGLEEAKELVEKYNKEGNDNLPPDYKRYRGPDRYADRDRNRSYSGGNYNNRDRDRYHSDNRNNRGSRGSYMGYSNNDRQRADRFNDRNDKNRYGRDSGRSYSGGNGRSSSGSYSSGGYNNNYSSSSGGAGGWGGSGSGWGSQGSGGSWGNQGWGNQGWGNQGYGSNTGWSGYNQQNQQSGNQWGNQGYYGNWSGYYGNQQGGWGGYSGGN